MFERFLPVLRQWNVRYGERQKLQHIYLAMIVVVTLGAGLVSLVNGKLGHSLMLVVLAAIIAFGTNAVIWHLLHSGLLLRLSTPKPQPRKQR